MEVLEHLRELGKASDKMFLFNLEEMHYSKNNYQVQCTLNYLTYWGE